LDLPAAAAAAAALIADVWYAGRGLLCVKFSPPPPARTLNSGDAQEEHSTDTDTCPLSGAPAWGDPSDTCVTRRRGWGWGERLGWGRVWELDAIAVLQLPS